MVKALDPTKIILDMITKKKGIRRVYNLILMHDSEDVETVDLARF